MGDHKYFQNNNRTKDMIAHSAKVHSVAWNCDGSRLASGSYDRTVCELSLKPDRIVKEHTYKGHTESVDQLCWHPSNANLFATASGDRTVRIWDCRSRKNVHTVHTKGENINICWHPDGSIIGVGNKEDLVSFIDVKTTKIKIEEQFKFEVNEISWNNPGNAFFLTSGQGTVQVYAWPNMSLFEVLPAHPSICICIRFDPTGKYFAVGSADALTSLWLADDLICVKTFHNLDWPVRSISFSHDGTLLASASEDLCIDISDIESGERIAEVTVDAPTFTVAFHPKRHMLAFACDDKVRDRDAYHDAGTVKVYGFPNDL